ncbi:MAG: UDP-N-acetylmuramoyl-tripeptide--D-alanyl-D-alanine ligase [Lachnospiraceae bacterium]|nr:UDP-N-acetylmuramoyl-tripeptide--D-alanyl-D-alanine ligase [Lachnospiraceae bacterium]
MPNLTLKNIATACGGIYIGPKELEEKVICGVVIDSRLVEQDYLFIPIKGERVDGHTFIEQVFEKGACCVLSEQELDAPKGPYIKVDSTELALKQIAKFYRQGLDIKVVGITGSVGKTSTKEMISSVISQKFLVHKTAGNFNNEIGLPLTIFGIRKEHEVAVLEMGISDFNEMHRLSEIANPDICVITNVGLCHLENLGTRDGVLKAKTECFEHMKQNGTAVLNGDDDKLSTKRIVNGKQAVFYGIEKEAKTDTEGASMAEKGIYATDIQNMGLEGMKATIHTSVGSFSVLISIPGQHNVYNALAATAVGLELGLTLEEIKKGIEEAKTIAGRTNVMKMNGMYVIDDCYNANPVSMKAALDVLSYGLGRTIAVLGDMGELGEKEKELHYGVGQCVADKKIDTLFCAGTLAKEYENGVKSQETNCKVFYFETRDDMIKELLSYVKTGDSILVKASHFMDFPKVVEALK